MTKDEKKAAELKSAPKLEEAKELEQVPEAQPEAVGVATHKPEAQPAPEVEPVQQPVQQPAQQPTPTAPSRVVDFDSALSGLNGWLGFFVVMFGLGGFGGVWGFFAELASLADSGASADEVLSAITMLVGGVLSLVTLFYMIQKRFLARKMAMATLITSYVLSALASLVALVVDCTTKPSYGWGEYLYHTSACKASDIILTVGGLVVSAIATGLLVMYFRVSERVKATLVK